MNFLQTLQKQTNVTRTENNAITNKSSLNPCLDFFGLAGAMRDRPQDAVKLFMKAFGEDELKAIRILFYLRDVRGGQGERNVFRECYDALWKEHPEVAAKVVKHIPEYGRWDDFSTYEALCQVGNETLGLQKGTFNLEC